MREQPVRIREAAVSRGVLRILDDRFLEKLDSFDEPFLGALVQVIASLQEEIVRREVFDRLLTPCRGAPLQLLRTESIDYGLRDRIRYRKGKTDALTAASALAEGDATYVMMAAIAGKPAVAPAEFRDAVTSGAKGGNVPDFLSSSLVSSYVDGYEFVYALVRNGGMDALGLAWARPPVTSEQILHPAKWRSGEKAIVIGPPPMPHTVDDDSLGELGLRTYLELGGNRHDAALAAGGWGGDRGSLSIDGEVVQFAWHYRADADAQGAAERVMAELAAVFRNLGTADSTGEGLCVTRADAGPLAAVKRGADIWLVAGPASSRTWRSQATCADARATVARVISAGAP